MGSDVTRRAQSKPTGDAKGFSVIELLVVLTVLGIAMIPLISLQFTSRREAAEAERMSVATQLALSQVERIKFEGFEAAVPDTLFDDPYTIITTSVADSTNPFLREVCVRVVWSGRGGEREVTSAVMQSALR